MYSVFVSCLSKLTVHLKAIQLLHYSLCLDLHLYVNHTAKKKFANKYMCTFVKKWNSDLTVMSPFHSRSCPPHLMPIWPALSWIFKSAFWMNSRMSRSLKSWLCRQRRRRPGSWSVTPTCTYIPVPHVEWQIGNTALCMYIALSWLDIIVGVAQSVPGTVSDWCHHQHQV